MNEIIIIGSEIKKRILTEINNASRSIYIAMAWFTDRDIADALINAKSRGVDVDIILSSHKDNETVKNMLRDAGIPVHAFETGDERGLMHHKFSLIDGRLTLNGSYNYTYNASKNNVENIHVSDNLDTYQQLFDEFERLKYNIDHDIPVNETAKPAPEINTPPVKPTTYRNMLSEFYNKLQNLVFNTVHIDSEEYRKRGYEKSQQHQGSIEIFKVEFGKIRSEINVLATDDSLGGRKNTLITQINHVFEEEKGELVEQKQRRMEELKRSAEIEKKTAFEKIQKLKDEKKELEYGNETFAVKGLLQINHEIEQNRLEKKLLEESIIIRPFWKLDTVLVLLLLAIFGVYLSVFFSSAIYKVFFEIDEIKSAMNAGNVPEAPKLIDADALYRLYTEQGIMFGFIATFFFLIPVLLTNLQLIGSKNQRANTIFFYVGIAIFDIIVATYIAVNAEEINCLLKGVEPDMKIWEAVLHKEFWMIFIFGSLPLLITHHLIANIVDRYRRSRHDMVNEEATHKIQNLERNLFDLNAHKELLTARIEDKGRMIQEEENKVKDLEYSLGNQITILNEKYADEIRAVKQVYDEFHTKIWSGLIFTDVIFAKVISAFKAGFVEFLPFYYAPGEVTARVKEIDHIITNNKQTA